MHNLIEKLFRKRGIEDVNQLDKEEKQTFEEWQAVLVKEELTTEDIKNFCKSQLNIIETKWADYNLDRDKKNDLLPYYTVYKTLLSVIDSPKQSREALEKNLIQLLSN